MRKGGLREEVAQAAGGGEPKMIYMGGVIANAIFDAAGVRLFELPMTPERIKKALTEAKNKKT